jgi:copper(I)-binding protein
MTPRAAAVLACAFLSIATSTAWATDVVTVSEPWVRPVAAQGTTRAFLVLGSSNDATLVAARSPIAEVDLVRGEQRAQGVPIEAGKPMPMSDGGPHLVLRRVARTLKLGDRVPLTLTLRHGDGRMQDIDTSAEVRRRSPIEDERLHHHHH